MVKDNLYRLTHSETGLYLTGRNIRNLLKIKKGNDVFKVAAKNNDALQIIKLKNNDK